MRLKPSDFYIRERMVMSPTDDNLFWIWLDQYQEAFPDSHLTLWLLDHHGQTIEPSELIWYLGPLTNNFGVERDVIQAFIVCQPVRDWLQANSFSTVGKFFVKADMATKTIAARHYGRRYSFAPHYNEYELPTIRRRVGQWSLTLESASHQIGSPS